MMPRRIRVVKQAAAKSNADTQASGTDAVGHAADRVDCHFHVFAAGSSAPGPVRYVPAYDATLTAWSQSAAAHGIRRGVLVQTSFLGTDNAQLLAALACAPQRLRGIAVLDPAVPRRELDALEAAGVRGIRLNLMGRDQRLSAAQLGLVARIGELGWHLELHTDRGALASVLDQLPQATTVVIDHFGKPASVDDTALWRAVRTRADHLHVKLSAPYRLDGLDPARLLARWRDELGDDRLLWGSDWPCTNHEALRPQAHALQALRTWLRDDATLQAKVLADNPRALYRFDQAPLHPAP